MSTHKIRNLSRLRDFITAFSRLLDDKPDEAMLIERGTPLLRNLLSVDDWLPPAFASAGVERYQQYLLHVDSGERFSVASFVWGPGQATPIHDHTTWGLIGVLRGAERAQRYVRVHDESISSGGRILPTGAATVLRAGEVDAVSPSIGDIHRVSNALADEVSVSVHVYGANVGSLARSVYDEDGGMMPFVSGYANDVLPNIWDRSAELNARLGRRSSR